MNDGPAAVARQDLISVFPSGVTLAATWDRELVYQSYKALGEEFRGKGTHVALGYVYSSNPLELYYCLENQH